MSASLVLRLYDEPEASIDAPADNQITDRLTVPEFYERYVMPVCHGSASPKTVKDARQTLGYWKRFTGDPALFQVDDFTGPAFVRGLRTLPGRGGKAIADNTIRKHIGTIQFILDRAGPRTRQSPQAAGLLDATPLIVRPALVINEVADNYSIAEMSTILTACSIAARPRLPRVDPCTWWRSIILFDYNVGLRFETLFLLRWEWIEEDELGWWFRIPGPAIKKRRGRVLYVNKAAREALSWVKPATGGQHGELVFPWPYNESWLHRTRRALFHRAGLPPHRNFGFRGFRKALATELAKINPVAAPMALGHSGRNVFRDHYCHKSVMTEAMQRLPQPTWDREAEVRQMRLFD